MRRPLMSPRRAKSALMLRARAFGGGPFDLGDQVTITITVQNNGNYTAYGLQAIYAIEDSAGTLIGYAMWEDSPVLDLASGQEAEFDYTFTVPSDATAGTASWAVYTRADNVGEVQETGTVTIVAPDINFVDLTWDSGTTLSAYQGHTGHVELDFPYTGEFIVGLGIGTGVFIQQDAGGWITVDVPETRNQVIDVPVGLSAWLDVLSPGECSGWYPIVGVKDANTNEELMNYRTPDRYEVQICA